MWPYERDKSFKNYLLFLLKSTSRTHEFWYLHLLSTLPVGSCILILYITMQETLSASQNNFIDKRNWDLVATFWSNLMSQLALPQFVAGDITGGYGITDLKAISASGAKEFASNDPRFKRQTFAIRIGYDGSKYNGYQRQKGMKSCTTMPYFFWAMSSEIQFCRKSIDGTEWDIVDL